MSKTIQIFALSALSVALVACGGGGSSGTSQARSATPVVNAGTNGNTNANTATPANRNTNTNPAQGGTAGGTGTTGNANTTPAKATGKTTSNTTASTKPMYVVDDFKGNKEFTVTRPASNLASEVNEVLKHTNRLRAEKGLPALKLNQDLSAYAQRRAEEVVKLFEHQRPDGKGWHTGVVGNTGENLAAGGRTGEAAVTQWRNSKDGHYESIIDPDYSTLGVGVVYVPDSKYKYYWVQIFGDDNSKSPYGFTGTQNTANPNLTTTVMVNGTPFSAQIGSAGALRHINHEQYQSWVNGYEQSRFGMLDFKAADEPLVFYQGHQTAESAMPKTGTATYNGRAMTIKNGRATTNLDSQFTANFGNKTLNGTIKQGNTTLYNLSADIKGSSFASKAGASVATEGAFFGNNAQELGGIFYDPKTDTKGAFGAKK